MQTKTLPPNKALSYYFYLRGWMTPRDAAISAITAFSDRDERIARLWRLSLHRR